MSNSIVSRHREKQPFFGDDGRGRLFTSLFLQGNYNAAVNVGNADSILGGDQWEVMRAENYEAQTAGMSNDDVHYEFTDLVTRTGLFHRSIDHPTGAGAGLVAAAAAIDAVLAGLAFGAAFVPVSVAPNLIAVSSGHLPATAQGELLRLLTLLATAVDQQAFDIAKQNLRTVVNNDLIQGSAGAAYTTLAASPNAVRLWQQVYGNWNNLLEETRQFYHAFMRPMKLNAFGKWIEMTEAEFSAVPDEAHTRINLIRSATAPTTGLPAPAIGRKNRPAFANVIPLVPSKVSSIWYSNAAGVHRRISTTRKLKYALVDAYEHAYASEHDLNNDLIALANLPPLEYFSLWVDKLVRKRLLYLKRSPVVSLPPSDEKTFISLADQNIWKHDGEGKLYRVVDGKTVNYGDEDQETIRALKSNFKCYSSLLNGDDAKCRTYMYDCLLSGDADGLSKCQAFHADANFYDVAVKDISNMHPIVALRTLEKYGFRYVLKYDDEAQMKLNKVECVSHWLENFMTKKFKSVADQQSVQNNKQLLDYLELIVQYVNANPTLINKHYSGSSDEAVGRTEPTKLASRFGIRQRVEPTGVSLGVYDINMLQSHNRSSMYGATMFRSPFSVSAASGLLRSPFGDTIRPLGVGMVIPQQMGGSGYYGGDLYSKRTKEGIIAGSQAIHGLIQVNVTAMERHNKKLAPEDLKKIDQKIANMREVEKELTRTLDYLHSYSQLLDAMGDYNNQTLSINTLRDLAGRHKDLSDKHNREEKSMVTVLGAIQKLIAGRDAPELTELEDANYQPVSLNRA